MYAEITSFFENLTGKDYHTCMLSLTDKLLGSTGAQILAWVCLVVAIFLILMRRVAAAGIILVLYIMAVFLAYAPAIVRLFK